jgi:hypothetical protein
METLPFEDLADLLALALRHGVDVALLDGAQVRLLLVLGLGAPVVARGHGEAIGDQIGDAENQDHPVRQLRADHAGDDGERRYGTVDAAVYPVAQIAERRRAGQPLGDRLFRVLVLHGRRAPAASGSYRAWRRHSAQPN